MSSYNYLTSQFHLIQPQKTAPNNTAPASRGPQVPVPKSTSTPRAAAAPPTLPPVLKTGLTTAAVPLPIPAPASSPSSAPARLQTHRSSPQDPYTRPARKLLHWQDACAMIRTIRMCLMCWMDSPASVLRPGVRRIRLISLMLAGWRAFAQIMQARRRRLRVRLLLACRWM